MSLHFGAAATPESNEESLDLEKDEVAAKRIKLIRESRESYSKTNFSGGIKASLDSEAKAYSTSASLSAVEKKGLKEVEKVNRELDLKNTFSRETNRRDEDAEMNKYIEEQIRLRREAAKKDREAGLPSSKDPTDKDDATALPLSMDSAADNACEILLQTLSENYSSTIDEKSELMLSSQMLNGIPEVGLGPNERIRTIEATEEAKLRLAGPSRDRSHHSSKRSTVSTNISCNQKMKNQEVHRAEHTYVVLDQEPPADDENPTPSHEDNVGEIEILATQSSDLSLDARSQRGLFTKNELSLVTKKIASALTYGICSFMITVINKIVLTSYGFPSFNILGIGQIIAILVILKVASLFRVVSIRAQSMRKKKLWTLAAFYLGNLITGLGGTKHLPLPMFIALRRFSIAMTAIGEFYVLDVRQSLPIVLTIVAMIAGSFIAAAADLTFNALGYILVMTSNFFTAANGVYTKKTIDSREINKHEILFYNALFALIPMTIVCICTTNLESLRNFQHWAQIDFILAFMTSCVMGYLLMFSTVLCTHYNSALTTTIVGTLKNILTTYVGMYIGGDYKFNMLNFMGLNVSLVGSLVYSYLSFNPKSSKPKKLPTKC